MVLFFFVFFRGVFLFFSFSRKKPATRTCIFSFSPECSFDGSSPPSGKKPHVEEEKPSSPGAWYEKERRGESNKVICKLVLGRCSGGQNTQTHTSWVICLGQCDASRPRCGTNKSDGLTHFRLYYRKRKGKKGIGEEKAKKATFLARGTLFSFFD